MTRTKHLLVTLMLSMPITFFSFWLATTFDIYIGVLGFFVTLVVSISVKIVTGGYDFDLD